MSRFLIAAIVVAVVLTVYAVIDCAMTDAKRARALSKPVWLLVVLVVPVIGPILWILFGKGLLLKPVAEAQQSAPDDDDAFLRSLGEDAEHADNIRRLEAELAALDEQFGPDGAPGSTTDAARLDDLPGDETAAEERREPDATPARSDDEPKPSGDVPADRDEPGDDEPHSHSDAHGDADGDGRGTARA